MHPALQLEGEKESYSYSELHAGAERIALLLEPHLPSIEPGSETPLVCIMSGRHYALIASMLGILLAGAAFVPVDPTFPTERQAYIFDHSRCSLLIADEESYTRAAALGVSLPPAIVVSSEGALLSEPPIAPRMCRDEVPPTTSCSCGLEIRQRHEASKSDGGIMYVLYTSGSTGKPKGVVVPNAGVFNVVSYFATQLSVGRAHCVLGLTTVCFDISMLEIFMPLSRGAKLILADSLSQKDPFRLLEIISEYKINIMQATPTTYEMLIATGWKGDEKIDFLVGGEAFRPSLLMLLQKCRSCRNVYGPTETSIWSSCYLLASSDKGTQPLLTSSTGPAVIPIGAPISDTIFYLADPEPTSETETLSLTTGAEGELLIGGIGVTRGYLHAPELTNKVFMLNPFGEGRLYRTGDLVRRLNCGNYVFIRRLDDQVKMGGFRIELAEIENVYQQDCLVEQAVVLVRGGILVAYLKILGGQNLSEAEVAAITAQASTSLTHYMVPKKVVQVKCFPQTPNGKLDRKALGMIPLPEETDVTAKAISSAAASPLVRLVLHVLKESRGVNASSSSSFASVGIDSIGGIFFIRALSDALGGISISPRELYSPGTTVGSFASKLQLRITNERPELLPVIEASADVKTLTMMSSGFDLEEGKAAGSEEGSEEAVDSLHFAITSNLRLLQGLRGLFTIMVLFDHYTSMRHSAAILADTSLFVILTGFSTALQMREQSIEAFNFTHFMSGKCIGILPILWLTLMLHVPRWVLQSVYLDPKPRSTTIGCAILNIVAMETNVPICFMEGPSASVYFASVILNTFLVYALLLWSYSRLEMAGFIKCNSCSFFGRIRSRTLSLRECYLYALIASVLSISLFMLASVLQFFNFQRTGIGFLPYFLGGQFAASVMSCLHAALLRAYPIQPILGDEEAQSESTESSGLSSVAAIYTKKVRYVVLRILKFFFLDSSSTLPLIPFRTPESVTEVCYRFTPDCILVVGVLFLCFLWGKGAIVFYRWAGLQIMTMIFMVLSMLQTNRQRRNLSRFFLESPFLNVLGYASYPICKIP